MKQDIRRPLLSGGAPPALAPDRQLLRVSGLKFTYPDGLQAVGNVSFDLRAGEVLSIIGLSGCGKSTLLSLLAGLKQPSAGAIEWHPDVIDEAPHGLPSRRRLSLVFQRDTVLPWKTVEENVAFGLNYLSIDAREKRERIDALLRIVKMGDFRKAYPKQLSGGVRRRVAVLTGVAPLPHLLLLDESFGGLDEPTRVAVHAGLLEIVYRLGLTVILVTHDLAEAITLGDRVLVLTHRPARVARVLQTGLGRPREAQAIRELPEYQKL